MRAILRRDRLIGFVKRHAVLVLTLLVNLLIIMGVIVIMIASPAKATAQLFSLGGSGLEYTTADMHCLAENIYFEANNQSRTGMISVARVVINRVNDSRYPDTVCGVIHDGPKTESWKTQKLDIPDTEREWVPVRNKCQFSWYCDGKADDIPNINDNYKWQMAQEIANDILELDRWSGIIDGATHYHANYVNPKWSSSLHYVGRVDDHLFYRWD